LSTRPIVHDQNDSVGVVVVEGVNAGQEITGWIMDQDKEIRVKVRNDIPQGGHVHVHNLKTKRW
jgi:(2R)-sulfolactate sulfo-lyase subunit alpha